MAVSKLLRIYLQDHDALAYVTVQLIRRTRSNNREGALASFLDDLDEAAIRHQSVVGDVMKRLGIRPRRDKRAAVWVAERFGRLKLNGRLLGYSDLSRVFELEGIGALLNMRLSSLETLQASAGDAFGLDLPLIDSLIEETGRLLKELRRYHREAAGALSG
jgi:hypothetical protein